MQDAASRFETPYPLARLFRRRFLPGFLLFGLTFALLGAFGARTIVETVYLEQAQRRAETIARAMEEQVPRAWARLMHGAAGAAEPVAPEESLMRLFADRAREMDLPEIKMYGLDRRVLYATNADEIGTREEGDALKAAIAGKQGEILSKTLPDGRRQYELYVPILDPAGAVRAVFELYEPVDYLDGLLLRAAAPAVLLPAALLAALLGALGFVVRRAQMDIDGRAAALVAVQRRLASFVSSDAVAAARGADREAGEIRSRSLETVLFFSDVRDFTGFPESATPEAVVAFLNEIMALQVEAVHKAGGDVDKMIGDAVFARFDGESGGDAALAAAEAIQQAVEQKVRDGVLPRRLGVGIHRGRVVAGAIGPADRRDFTVIGDAVNAAARLCALADAGEILCDADLVEEGDGFGPPETVQVKGRREGLLVRRRYVRPPAGAAG